MPDNDYQVYFSFGYCTISVMVLADHDDEERIIDTAVKEISADIGLSEEFIRSASDIQLDVMGRFV